MAFIFNGLGNLSPDYTAVWGWGGGEGEPLSHSLFERSFRAVTLEPLLHPGQQSTGAR